MTQLARGLGASLVLVAATGVIALIAIALYARSLRRRGASAALVRRGITSFALVLVVLAIAAVALVPTAYAGQERALTLIPGHGLDRPWQSSIAAGNIFGNMLLFLPLGFLLPLRFGWLRPAGRLVLLVTASSLGIELAQYALNLGRAADINDIVFNVAGAAVGWAAFAAVQAFGGLTSRGALRPTHRRQRTAEHH
jgi:glycopeptide antibiotics resistance protein